MDIIKQLDLEWFWLGYSVGVNSRKRIADSPNKILNLGKQGVKKVPTDKQKVSFFIGVYMGRGKIVQNFDVVKVIQYQDKNSHKSKGDWLTLSIGSKEAKKGDTVKLPLYISNNSVDNRGFAGFQAKIKYNPNHLTLKSISPSTSWTSSFNVEHDAENGVVLIQGLRDAIGYEDMVVGWLEFYVSDSALSKNQVGLCGPSGDGSGSDLLTLINGQPYYIMPLTLESGCIEVAAEYTPTEIPEPPLGQTPTYVPPIEGEITLDRDTSFSWEFDMILHIIRPYEGPSGADLVVKITTADGQESYIRIPVVEGEHHYSGKAPLQLPSMGKGPIQIEMWVETEDEDAIAYYFIKAGALWGFETTIPRNEVNQIPIVEPTFKGYEYFVLYDGYILEISDLPIEPFDPNVVDSDIFILKDGYLLEFNKILSSSEIGFMILKDGYAITLDDIPFVPVMPIKEEWNIDEIMQLFKGYDLRLIVENSKDKSDSMTLSDGFNLTFEED